MLGQLQTVALAASPPAPACGALASRFSPRETPPGRGERTRELLVFSLGPRARE